MVGGSRQLPWKIEDSTKGLRSVWLASLTTLLVEGGAFSKAFSVETLVPVKFWVSIANARRGAFSHQLNGEQHLRGIVGDSRQQVRQSNSHFEI